MSSGEAAVDVLNNLGANFWLERDLINKIAKPIFAQGTRPGTRPEPLELDAIAAVAAHMYTNADLTSMAELMETTQLNSTEISAILQAAVKLTRQPQFSKELFDGDAGPMIRAEVAKARRHFRIDP